MYVFVRTEDGWAQEAYLKASNTDAFDNFGWSVAISGDTIVVGAPREDGPSQSVGGNQGNGAGASGAAYVFVRDRGQWSQQAYLKASNAETADQLGTSVGIDGDTIVAGAEGEDSGFPYVKADPLDNTKSAAGAAYVFVRSGGVWTEEAYLKSSNPDRRDFFGEELSICGDTIVFGCRAEASAAAGINGNQNDDSDPFRGAAYVFVRESGSWQQEAYIKPSGPDVGEFGQCVGLSGDTLVVGAMFEDSDSKGVNGTQSSTFVGNDTGAAYVFQREGGSWTQQAFMKASNPDQFDYFGRNVAIDGDRVVVTAQFEDSRAMGWNGNQEDNSVQDAGAAYLFTRTNGTWSQTAYLKSKDPEFMDRFGANGISRTQHMSAISKGVVVAGVPEEDSLAVGVNGDFRDNGAPESGAVYVFESGSTLGSFQQAPSPVAAPANQSAGVFDAVPYGGMLVGNSLSLLPVSDGEQGEGLRLRFHTEDQSAARAFFVSSGRPADIPLNGGRLLVDLTTARSWFSRTVRSGVAEVAFPSLGPGTLPSPFYLQGFLPTPSGLKLSNGLEIRHRP